MEDERVGFRECAELMLQMAEALEHAHGERVYHRDVKPSNILLDQDGQAHLADFGLAHRDEESSFTETGQILGTWRYISPEQAVGNVRAIDGRSDVYSLGVVLYELLTGQVPFQGDIFGDSTGDPSQGAESSPPL